MLQPEDTVFALFQMIRAGLFKDVDISLTWHPGNVNCVSNINALALIQAYFRFHGKTAHAAADPYNGRSF